MTKPTSLAEFLGFIFDGLPDGAHAAIASTHVMNNKPVFPAQPWPEYTCQDFHTHYSLGVFLRSVPTENGNKFRRRDAAWMGAKLLVLEDVGEDKVPNMPGLEPTFKIRTKPGSEQWGYVFNELITDKDKFDRMLRASVAAGLSDPGGQNVTRLVRLPGSQPDGKKHKAQIVDWTGQRFSVDELIEGLGLNLEAVPAKKAKGGGRGRHHSVSSADPLIEWMNERGMLVSERDGWNEIICPWCEEHTDSASTGTGYTSPKPDSPHRSFHCFHRCSGLGRDTEAFLDWVRAEGGPDLSTLDDAVIKSRKEANIKLRERACPGDTDPVTLTWIKAVHSAQNEHDLMNAMSRLVWYLVEQEWSDTEILSAALYSMSLDIHADNLAGEIYRMADSSRTKQLQRRVENADDEKRQRIFMKLAKDMPREVRAAAAKWLGRQG